MPVYTYVCGDCGKRFDLMMGVSSEKVELKCVTCGSENIKRTIAAFSVGKTGGQAVDFDGGCSSGSCSTGSCPTGF